MVRVVNSYYGHLTHKRDATTDDKHATPCGVTIKHGFEQDWPETVIENIREDGYLCETCFPEDPPQETTNHV